MANFQGVSTEIDITYVIDGTGSMTPIIDEVKKTALGFHEVLKDKLSSIGYDMGKCRIRVIEYCDFASEGEEAIKASDFFNLPEQSAEFEACVNGIVPGTRGGDKPENGFEALYTAITGDWEYTSGFEKHRHIIVVFTDAAPLPLHARKGCVGYPDTRPANIDELQAAWDCEDQSIALDKRSRRLVVFGPEEICNDVSWQDLGAFDNFTCQIYEEGKGLEGLNLDVIVEEIAKTVVD